MTKNGNGSNGNGNGNGKGAKPAVVAYKLNAEGRIDQDPESKRFEGRVVTLWQSHYEDGGYYGEVTLGDGTTIRVKTRPAHVIYEKVEVENGDGSTSSETALDPLGVLFVRKKRTGEPFPMVELFTEIDRMPTRAFFPKEKSESDAEAPAPPAVPKEQPRTQRRSF